jgi:hypothetical protein
MRGFGGPGTGGLRGAPTPGSALASLRDGWCKQVCAGGMRGGDARVACLAGLRMRRFPVVKRVGVRFCVCRKMRLLLRYDGLMEKMLPPPPASV